MKNFEFDHLVRELKTSKAPLVIFGTKKIVISVSRRFFRVWTVTSFLITRFFFPIPEMKARDHAIRKHHRNQESLQQLRRFCIKHPERCSAKGGTGSTFCSIYNCRYHLTPVEEGVREIENLGRKKKHLVNFRGLLSPLRLV